MSGPTLTITARGHAAVTATHAKTFELTEDDDIGPRATCVIGVGAHVSGDRSVLAGPVEITLDTAGRRLTVRAAGNPFIVPGEGFVVRKSDFLGADTLAVDADTAAAELDRAFVHALQDPAATLLVTVRAAGPPNSRAVFTDTAAPQPGPDDDVRATTALGQVRACAALAGAGAGALLLADLPKGATARRARVAQALAAAAVVVWRGPAKQAEALLTDHAHDVAAVAVDRGEAATRVIAALPDAPLPPDAAITLALRGHAAPEDDDRLGPVLAALRAEGVSARTLRQALARLPHLAARWDYDAINRLGRGPDDR